MSNITEVTSALISPDQTLEDTDLKTTWIDNPEGLRDRTFGAGTLAPLGALAHDHGQGRGLQLDRAILSLSFGPHNEEGEAAADALIGAPVYAPSGSVDFSSTPKLLASSHLFLPGGVANLFVAVVCNLPGSGSRSFELTIGIRPLREAGLSGPEEGLSTSEAQTFSTSAVSAPFFIRKEYTFTSENLRRLGDVSLDREGEICVWLTSDPTASQEFRLCSLLVYPGTAPTALGPTEPLTYQSVSTVTPLEIHEGAKLVSPLFDKARARLNQDTLGVLGAVPGLTADAQTPDTSVGWRLRVREPHQHRGRRHTNAQGETVPDGACLRYGGWGHTYINDLGDDESAQTMDGAPYLGQPTRPSGITTFEGRLSIPDGLKGMILRFALYPETTAGTILSRLYVSAHLSSALSSSAGGTNLLTHVKSGPYTDDSGERPITTDFRTCLVDPIDTAAYQPNAARQSQGLGLWVRNALLSGGDQPDNVDTTNAYRISQEVFLGVGVTDTADYRLRLRFELEIGALGGGSYENSTRLNWVAVFPAWGY